MMPRNRTERSSHALSESYKGLQWKSAEANRYELIGRVVAESKEPT